MNRLEKKLKEYRSRTAWRGSWEDWKIKNNSLLKYSSLEKAKRMFLDDCSKTDTIEGCFRGMYLPAIEELLETGYTGLIDLIKKDRTKE